MAQDRLLSRRSRPSKHWSRPRFADFDDRNRTTIREPERETAGRPPRPGRTALLRRQDLFLGTGFGQFLASRCLVDEGELRSWPDGTELEAAELGTGGR